MTVERRSFSWIAATSLIMPFAALLQPSLAALGVPMALIGSILLSISYLAIAFRHHRQGSFAQWSYTMSYGSIYSRNELLVLASAAGMIASGVLTTGLMLSRPIA